MGRGVTCTVDVEVDLDDVLDSYDTDDILDAFDEQEIVDYIEGKGLMDVPIDEKKAIIGLVAQRTRSYPDKETVKRVIGNIIDELF